MLNVPRYYILVGDKQSWNISLKEKIWGFKGIGQAYGSWNKTKIGDFAALYVTSPISKIIGFCKITGKYVDDRLIWPDEKYFKKPIFTHKISYEIIHLLDDWEEGIHVMPNIMLNQGRKVIDKSDFSTLVELADTRWKQTISSKIPKYS